MSMGGDFYALSDQQLQNLLDGSLDYAQFLDNALAEKPRECFSEGEIVWFELTQMLEPEYACGIENTDAIPEMSGYSFAEDVAGVAEELAALDEAALRERYDEADMMPDFAEMQRVIQSLTAFYQRAAQNGDAVLFRVT